MGDKASTKEDLINELNQLRKRNAELESLLKKERTVNPPFNVINSMRDVSERLQMEEALCESEEIYRKIVETANEGIGMLDAQGRITFANKKLAAMCGYSVEEMPGKLALDFVAEEDLSHFNQKWEKTKADDTECNFDFRFRKKDGSFVWAIISRTPLKDKAGNFAGTLVMFTDITERKRRERNSALIIDIERVFARLSSPEDIMAAIGEKVKQFFGVTRLTFSDVDETGDIATIIYAIYDRGLAPSSRSWRLSNYATRGLLAKGQTGQVLVVDDITTDPRFAGPAETFSNRAIRSQLTASFEQDGHIRFIIAMHDSRPRHWRADEIELFEELSARIYPRLERARAEELLSESEQRLSLALSAGRLGIWDDRVTRGQVVVNDQYFRILGLPPGEKASLYGFLKLIHPEDLPALKSKIHLAFREGGDFGGEFRVLWRDGTLHWIEMRAHVDLNQAGHAARHYGVLIDTTVRKQAEAALRESEEKYRELVKYAPAGIFEIDFQKKQFLSVNDAMCELTGYSREELLAMNPMDVLDDRSKRIFQTRISKWLQGENPGCNVDYKVIAKDGREIYASFNVTITAGENGRPLGATVISHDITERRKMEEALRISEEKLRTILDNSRDGIAMLDLHTGRYVFLNSAISEITGYSEKEMHQFSGWDACERAHPDDKEMFIQKMNQIAAGKTQLNEAVIRWMRKDGAYRWLSFRSKLIRDSYGRPASVVTICRDITEQKEDSDKLAFQAQLLSNVQDAIVAVDENDAITYCNKALEDMFAWKQAELLGLNYAEKAWGYMDDDSREKVLRNMRRKEFLASAKDSSDEILCWGKDGRKIRIDVNSTMLKGPQGEYKGFISSFRDVSKRKEAEEALHQSKEKEKLFSMVASRLLASKEPQEIIDKLCQQTMEYLGCDVFLNYLADQERGCLRLNAWSGIPEEEARKIEWLDYGDAICGCAAQGGCRIVAENISDTPDPRIELVRSYGVQAYACHPLMIGEQAVGTISFGTRSRVSFTEEDLAVMKTVSEQIAIAMNRLLTNQQLQQSEKKAQKLVEKLRQADQAKNEFLGILSHELRNPLASIMMSLALQDRVPPGSEQARQAGKIIVRQAAQLARLVDDLLDVTRITRNKIELKKERLELNELARKAVADCREQFAAKKIGLEVNLTPAPLYLIADPVRLTQAIGNLLHNAVKFTSKGDKTLVTVAKDEGKGQVVILVQDNGMGIPSEILPHLFEPFTQVDCSLDRARGGLGLGLAIVKGMVELHGGSVSVRSEGLGKGTLFTIRLPLPALENNEQAQEPAAGGQPARALRILVIDDIPDIVEILCSLLTHLRHEVISAYNGPEGIARAKEFHPEVLLCDIGLPGMSGYEVARHFRSDPELKDIFLIALSGYALPEDLEKSRAAGFDRHLAKPVDLAILEQTLAEVPQETAEV